MFRFGYTMDGPQVGYSGARAIYQGSYYDYFVDLIPNRQSGTDISDEFLDWLNKTAMPWLKREVKEQRLSIATPKLLTLEDGKFELKANTNGSHGYLYIGAIEKEEASQPHDELTEARGV